MAGKDVSPARKLTLLLLGSVAFGVIMAVIKGQNAGVRDAVGNLSAPWVVIPFLAATREILIGVGVGAIAYVAASRIRAASHT
jgi:hypothetical protein